MDIEEKYQLAVEAGEKAYNDTEGNLEYAIYEALKFYESTTPSATPEKGAKP